MLRKIIFLLLGVIIGLPLNVTGFNDKNVIFIHGYDGDESTWSEFSHSLKGIYHLQGPEPLKYLSRLGAQSFADEVLLRNQGFFQNELITIAHSFGGVVSRHIDLTHQGNLGGLITVGSPLSGAGIAQSINNGLAAPEMYNGVYQLRRGWNATTSFAFSFIGNAVTAFFADLIHLDVNVILSVLSNNYISHFTSINNSTRDMQFNSDLMNAERNLAPTNLPKISIYGNEEGPTSWNYLGSMANKNGPRAANIAHDIYYVLYISCIVAGTILVIEGSWTLNPTHIWRGIELFWVAGEWKAGDDWILDFDRIWNVLIGANIPNQICWQQQAYICYYPSSSSSCWQTRTYCITGQLNGQSDGFIPAGSQTGFGSTSWTGVPLVEALGVNHSEEHDKDNFTMQGIFRDIFTGNPVPYFQVDKR
jgi:pimeloyl-ACP methyl ester carboxylesterase